MGVFFIGDYRRSGHHAHTGVRLRHTGCPKKRVRLALSVVFICVTIFFLCIDIYVCVCMYIFTYE